MYSPQINNYRGCFYTELLIDKGFKHGGMRICSVVYRYTALHRHQKLSTLNILAAILKGLFSSFIITSKIFTAISPEGTTLISWRPLRLLKITFVGAQLVVSSPYLRQQRGKCATAGHPNDPHQGDTDEIVSDPLGNEVWHMWTSRATQNTNVFSELFQADPDNCGKYTFSLSCVSLLMTCARSQNLQRLRQILPRKGNQGRTHIQSDPAT